MDQTARIIPKISSKFENNSNIPSALYGCREENKLFDLCTTYETYYTTLFYQSELLKIMKENYIAAIP